MKTNVKYLIIFCLFALFSFNACQDEAVQETDNPGETIAPNSEVINLMQSTASNDGSLDNILDGTDCFSINLPVTIIVNDITITINSLEDLAFIVELFEEFQDDDDILEFLFPITIILNDYTEIVIENEDELEEFIEDCLDNEEESIECVDFVYPISFSIYNSDFQLIDTVVIESDEALYEFLDSLEDNPNGAVIASLNYPVTLIYADGSTVEVNSNQELEAAINAAEEECDDDEEEEECDFDDVSMYLQECHWVIVAYNGDDHLIDYDVYFEEGGLLTIINGDNVAYNGNWTLTETDAGLVLNIETAFEDLNGSWHIVDCDDDRFELVLETDNNVVEMVIEQECEDDLECSAQEISMYLQECLWYSGTNLLNNDFNGPYNFGENGVVTIETSNGNVITGTWQVVLTDNGVYLVLDLPEPYDLISLEWEIVECDDDRLELINGDNHLVFEQDCNDDYDCEDLQANVGDTCFVENQEGFINEDCECVVENEEFDCPDLEANFGDDCENPNGVLGFINENCECEVENEEFDCPDLEANFGDDCELNGAIGFINENCECEIEDNDPFECFGNYGLSSCDEEDGNIDGFGVFDLNLIFSNCPNDDIAYNFYETIADAESQVNPLVNPYVNTVNPQTIYSRVFLAGDPNVFEIFSHDLIVEVCSQSGCSEQEVDAYLVECIWNVVNYNESDDLIIYNFDFETNSNIVVIYNDDVTIDAFWSTSQTNDGVVIEFSNVSGANIQAITGSWLVVECEPDRLEMHRENDIMVMEQNCN